MTKKTKYTVDYFINFFSKIPKPEWGRGSLVCEDGTKCTLGHLGVRDYTKLKNSPRIKALAEILNPRVTQDNIWASIYNVNDSTSLGKQKNPKDNMLYALKKAKKRAA
jgi:hypothetical protein